MSIVIEDDEQHLNIGCDGHEYTHWYEVGVKIKGGVRFTWQQRNCIHCHRIEDRFIPE